jgi:SET domain-containing protein
MHGRKSTQLSSKAHAGTLRHLKLRFPAMDSNNPLTCFKQLISILDQLCEQYKEQISPSVWKPISQTSRELKVILRIMPTSGNNDLMTQRDDISVIHANWKQTFGKRYILQISPDRSRISLAVAGSSNFYDLLINIHQDDNILLTHKAFIRRASGNMVMELQLITMPLENQNNDSYMYSISSKPPPKRRKSTTNQIRLKEKQLQQLSLSPDLYVKYTEFDGGGSGRVQITHLEFEKMFGVKLLDGLSLVNGVETDANADDTIISGVRNICRSFRRLQPHIEGHLSYKAGINNGSLDGVSQESLLDAILAVGNNKNMQKRLPHVVIVKINDLIGYGLFAGEYIPAGMIIGEYCGMISKVTPLDKDEQDNTYFAAYAPNEVPGSEMFVVDARKYGNSARFINHSSQNSNATWAHVFDGKKFRIIIAAVKPIPEGRQILLKYKDSYWSSKRGGTASHLSNLPYLLE